MSQEAKTESSNGRNLTHEWLGLRGKAYLANSVLSGGISYLTALQSAIDPRSLSQRLSDWDRERSLVKIPKNH